MTPAPNSTKNPKPSDPFLDFQPILWNPASPDKGRSPGGIYSIKRNHGIVGFYKLHNINDAINDDRSMLDKVLIEYTINSQSYSIFSVGDLMNAPYEFDESAEGNIAGDIAERIARRVMKYFLKHWNKHGKTGGIFGKRFDPAHRDDFIIANTKEFVLKIDHYPNLIILKRTGRGKFGYENIKEIDGFFDYRFQGKRHILVLESKLEKINVDCDDLVKNLFTPLRALFPEAQFNYVLFTDKNSIYLRNSFARRRQLRPFPITLHKLLHAEAINTLFFSFNEKREDFDRMKDFLITQYRALSRQSVTLYGKTRITDREIMIFDGGETPHIKLVKDLATGFWKEMPLRHKRLRK